VRRVRTALGDRMGIVLPIVQAPAGLAAGPAASEATSPTRLPAARLIHDMAEQAATTGGLLHSLAV